jgi:hypothetical protein
MRLVSTRQGNQVILRYFNRRFFMRKSYQHLPSAVILCLLSFQSVRADDISEAALGLCEKVKSCAMAQIAEEDLTPELRQMMQPMLDTMCANMQAKVADVDISHPLYAPAAACMRSMEALTCEMMQDSQQMQTSECEAYEEMVKETDGAG